MTGGGKKFTVGRLIALLQMFEKEDEVFARVDGENLGFDAVELEIDSGDVTLVIR